MSARNKQRHGLGRLFVDSHPIVEAIQSEQEHAVPFRLFRVLFPIHAVEAFGEIEEEHEYELLEQFIEMGIEDGELTSISDLDRFFGLDDIQIIEKMIAFLVTIDHVQIDAESGRLELTALGKRSLELEKSCRILKTWRTFYFDSFMQKPLPRPYYDMHLLSPREANDLQDRFIYRLEDKLLSGILWERAMEGAMKRLAEQDDRANYNLPRGIKISDEPGSIKSLGIVYLPMNIIEIRRQDALDAAELSEFQVFTRIRGFKDEHFTRLLQESKPVQELLLNTAERADKGPEVIIKEWIEEQPFERLARLERNEKQMWRLCLEREVFTLPALRNTVRLSTIGNYRLAGHYYFVQYWCEDEQVRYDAALEQLATFLDRLQRQHRLTVERVENIFARVQQNLQVEITDWAALRLHCFKRGLRNLVGDLEELLVNHPLLLASKEPAEDDVLLEEAEENEDFADDPPATLQLVSAPERESERKSNLLAEQENAILAAGVVPLEKSVVAQWPAAISDQLAVGVWQSYGDLATDARRYRPLDTVRVSLQGRVRAERPDAYGILRVYDGARQLYFETTITLSENQGQTNFIAVGKPGTHSLLLFWPEEEQAGRILPIQIECDTMIESGDADFDCIYPLTYDVLRLARRVYRFSSGPFVGYASADAWDFDGVYLRDWIYSLPACKYWEEQLTCGIERILEILAAGKPLPNRISADGKAWRTASSPDSEYIFVLAVWQTWCAQGDETWLGRVLPWLEQLLDRVQHDTRLWDQQRQLVKRAHSYDTWDPDDTGACSEDSAVIALGDQTGYYLAFSLLSRMYQALQNEPRAIYWRERAEAYRERAVSLLWDEDGQKFLHHIHLAPIEHGDFAERDQLAMGNTWAITRGLADAAQARQIIDEYRRRQEETGDAYPWWSLQPGYPSGNVLQRYYPAGSYANGGLMPWVGGELCLGAFLSERVPYALELLRQYAEHLRRHGGAYPWYWPDGEIGFSTGSEVPCAGWGLAQWLAALIEGLAGVRDRDRLWQQVDVAPCWLSTALSEVRVIVGYKESQHYFAYKFQADYEMSHLTCLYCGSGQEAHFRFLLPHTWQPPATVLLNDQSLPFECYNGEDGLYITCTVPIQGAGRITLLP